MIKLTLRHLYIDQKNKMQKKPLQIFGRLCFSLNFNIMANIRCGIGII